MRHLALILFAFAALSARAAEPAHRNADAFLKYYREKLGGLLREITFTQRSKLAMVETLTLWLEQAKVGIQREATELRNQLASYQFRRGRFADILQMGAPDGAHDDLLCALLLSVTALDRHWLGGTQISLAPG